MALNGRGKPELEGHFQCRPEPGVLHDPYLTLGVAGEYGFAALAGREIVLVPHVLGILQPVQPWIRRLGNLVVQVERPVRVNRHLHELVLHHAVRDGHHPNTLGGLSVSPSLRQYESRVSQGREVLCDELHRQDTIPLFTRSVIEHTLEMGLQGLELPAHKGLSGEIEAPRSSHEACAHNSQWYQPARFVRQLQGVHVAVEVAQHDHSLNHFRPCFRQRIRDTNHRSLISRRIPRHRRHQRFELLADHLFAGLNHSVETGHHVAVHRVHATAAYRVVGMILQQQFPCVADLSAGIRAIQSKVRIASQGLDIAGKQLLGVLVALF